MTVAISTFLTSEEVPSFDIETAEDTFWAPIAHRTRKRRENEIWTVMNWFASLLTSFKTIIQGSRDGSTKKHANKSRDDSSTKVIPTFSPCPGIPYR